MTYCIFKTLSALEFHNLIIHQGQLFKVMDVKLGFFLLCLLPYQNSDGGYLLIDLEEKGDGPIDRSQNVATRNVEKYDFNGTHLVGVNRGKAFSIADLNKEHGHLFTSQNGDDRRRGLGLKAEKFNFDDFNSYETMMNYIDEVGRNHSFVEVVDISKTFEGRRLVYLKIGPDKTKPANKSRPVVWIDGGIHAREWISPATVFIIIRDLIKQFKMGEDNEYTTVDWYIFPMVNPDGYAYTMISAEHRAWRENRRKTAENCYGVDLNRNFPGPGYGVGSTLDPCDEQVYRGETAGSEAETKALMKVVKEHRERIRFYLTVHSYGGDFLLPYGYKLEKPKNFNEIESVVKEIAEVMSTVNGRPYKFVSASSYGLAGGASDDWAKEVLQIPYVACLELPPAETDPDFEFYIPSKYIKPIGEEVFVGMKVLATAVYNKARTFQLSKSVNFAQNISSL